MDKLINKTVENWYTSKKVTEITAIIGNIGYGKTYCTGKIQEIYEDNKWPFGVIDKMGIHYVLRSHYDKVIIIGGEHGDYGLDEIDEIMPIILNSNYNFILDLSEFTEIYVQEYIAEYFEYLYEWHKQNRKPRNYIIEEADAVLGQNGTLRECKSILLQCITKGRMYGFGFTLVSQRYTMIDKTALAQTRNYIVFNLKQPRDLATLKQLVGEDVGFKVRRLTAGKCLIMTDKGHGIYKVGLKKSQDVAMTPEVGIVLKEATLKPLNKEIAESLKI